jgi:hypothetical protein
LTDAGGADLNVGLGGQGHTGAAGPAGFHGVFVVPVHDDAGAGAVLDDGSARDASEAAEHLDVDVAGRDVQGVEAALNADNQRGA